MIHISQMLKNKEMLLKNFISADLTTYMKWTSSLKDKLPIFLKIKLNVFSESSMPKYL